MSVFVSAVLSVMGSDLILSMIGISIPFLALGTLSSIFISKGSD